MVYLNTDDLQGNTDSFGKNKMIENVLIPNITKVATQAGLLSCAVRGVLSASGRRLAPRVEDETLRLAARARLKIRQGSNRMKQRWRGFTRLHF